MNECSDRDAAGDAVSVVQTWVGWAPKKGARGLHGKGQFWKLFHPLKNALDSVSSKRCSNTGLQTCPQGITRYDESSAVRKDSPVLG